MPQAARPNIIREKTKEHNVAGGNETLDLHIADDVVTLVLLGSIVLFIGLPCAFLIAWRITRPPLRISSFRWLYIAWAFLLIASSVWNVARDPRFSVEEAGADNYFRLASLALGVLIILAIGAAYRFVFFSELRAGALRFFFLFALWGLATTLWSVSPAGTLVKSGEYLAMVMLIALAVSLINTTTRDPQDRALVLKSVFDFGWFLVFVLIASVYLGVLIWPEHAIDTAWRDEVGVVGFSIEGVFPGISYNGVGQLGAILGVVAFARILMRPGFKIFYGSLFVLGLITMVLAQSRSPVLAFSVAIIVMLVASRRFRLLALSGTALGGVMLTQYGQLMYDFMRRGQSTELLTSLTGRVEYWGASLDAFWEQPLSGYGANVGGRYVLQSAFGEESVSTIHSTWVEVLLDTGVVGLVLLSLGFGVTCFWLLKLRPVAMKALVTGLLWLEGLGVLTVLSVRSVFSVDLVWSREVLLFGLVLILIGVLRRQVAQVPYARAHLAQPLPAAWRRGSGVRS